MIHPQCVWTVRFCEATKSDLELLNHFLYAYVWSNKLLFPISFFFLFFYLTKSNKVGDSSRGWPEGSFFSSYYTEA